MIISTIITPLAPISPSFIGFAHAQDNETKASDDAAEKKIFAPYFVSLRYRKTFVRSGPGRNYPVLWVYNKQHIPLEVINRLDDWVQIRDWVGDEGWILRNQTRRKNRYAIVVLEEISMYQKDNKDSRKIARLAYELIGKIKSCNLQWCHLTVGDTEGWARRAGLWGLYPNDTIN